MRYDEYLAAGYPIATGVIEGACRHLVKDRMERSGMRWRLESAQQMLHVRAVYQSSYWDEFQLTRIQQLQTSLHPAPPPPRPPRQLPSSATHRLTPAGCRLQPPATA